MPRGPDGAPQIRRLQTNNYVQVTASMDREALEALDILVARLGRHDRKRLTVSSAIRSAVVYMERATRDGEA
jgi:hypothetical protein